MAVKLGKVRILEVLFRSYSDVQLTETVFSHSQTEGSGSASPQSDVATLGDGMMGLQEEGVLGSGDNVEDCMLCQICRQILQESYFPWCHWNIYKTVMYVCDY